MLDKILGRKRQDSGALLRVKFDGKYAYVDALAVATKQSLLTVYDVHGEPVAMATPDALGCAAYSMHYAERTIAQ